MLLTCVVFCSSLMDELVGPLQDRLEDWKKNTVQIDKEHAKGMSAFAVKLIKLYLMPKSVFATPQ